MGRSVSVFPTKRLKGSLMNLFRLRIEQILFSLAIFVLIFSNDEKYALLFQVLGVALICAAAAVCLLRGKTRLIAPTIFDALMLLMASMSLLASVISFEQYVAVYTIIFLITYAAIMVLTRSMNEEEIMACAHFYSIYAYHRHNNLSWRTAGNSATRRPQSVGIALCAVQHASQLSWLCIWRLHCDHSI